MSVARKVLMLLENYPAPADARVWPEALALRDAGYQITIICPAGLSKDRERYEYLEGIHIYRYHLPQGHSVLTYVTEYAVSLLLTSLLSIRVWWRHGFDIIHSANPPDLYFLIALFYRLFGKKYVFDQHDLTPEMFQALYAPEDGNTRNRRAAKRLQAALLLFERCSYRTAHLVIVTNLSFLRLAQTRGHCPPSKVVVVRNGPDLRRFQLRPIEPALKMGRRYMLAYVGVMGLQDGVEYLVRILHELVHLRGRQDISMVLMGDGASLPRVRALAHDLQLDAYLTLNGTTPKADVARYLAAADIGLVPDPQNGVNELSTMVKTMEYMAMQLPVVAFDLAETRFSAQDAGLYATPNQIEAFADRIEELLDNEALRREMGRLGRQRVEDQLSWQHSREHLIAAYTKAFGSQSRTSPSPPEGPHQQEREPAMSHLGQPAGDNQPRQESQ